MTFSGLPSVRDPKQSLKHSNSSASSTTSSTVSSSPKSPASEQQQRHQHDLTDVVLPDPNTQPVPASVIETSFEGLVHNGSSNIDMESDLRLPNMPLETKQHAKTTKAALTKKKGVPQNLTPAQSAAYRKRLNVNQVCDWCRYRKIRCDREAPCNSCQHSRRECIRTPSSVLLSNLKGNQGNNTDAESSSSSSTFGGKTKRGRTGSKDGRSRKSYRSSSTGSHHTTFTSSDADDDDEEEEEEEEEEDHDDDIGGDTNPPFTPTLTLSGLGFGSLGNIAQIRNSLGQDSAPWSGYGLHSLAPASPSTGMNGHGLMSSSSMQMDQEHVDRMRRIEILLGNVIPGAAEFIANGRDGPQSSQRQQPSDVNLGESLRGAEKKGLSIITQGLDQQRHQADILSPQDRFARISLASPAIQSTENAWPNFPVESTTQQLPSSPAPDYIERMKRIELLLSTVQDQPFAMTLMNQVQEQSPIMDDVNSPSDNKKLSKKELKRTVKSKKNGQLNGQAVKRPHVAAGFAGQKPPPKLPQAIAEAALKKQNARKKRATATKAALASQLASASTSPGSSAGNQDSSMGTVSSAVDQETDSRKMMLSPTASLGIPTVIENNSPLSVAQQHGPQSSLLIEQKLHMLHNRGSSPYLQQQQQHQYGAQPLNEFQQYQYPYHTPSPVSNIGSMTIPSFSEPIASYGSLVVPASTSPASSATSSPRTARAESVSVDGSVQDGGRSMSTTSVDTVGSGVDHQQHALFLPGQSNDQYSQLVLGEGESPMRFEFSSQALSPEAVAVALQHQQQQQTSRDAYSFTQNHQHSLLQQLQLQQLQQQYQQQLQPQRPMHIGQDLGLNMNESLESLMKKNMSGSLEGFDPQTLLSAPVSASSFGQSLYDTSSAGQFSTFPAQQPQLPFQGTSMWTPNPSDSFAIPAHESQLSWQQVTARPQPQQTLQSINISVSDSPTQAEMKLPMDMSLQPKQAPLQQQKQFGAHALFQQQSLQQHPLQQHRVSISIQHQHQQSFYIPQDDDEDEAEDENEGQHTMYSNNTTDNTSNSNDHSSSIGKEGGALSVTSSIEV
ncbi:hypothetical protein B0O80DRAFT_501836 [Mortierella sp. GBAus27b]|nr:hypothetical protein BGX31_000767 [Mortierella sp. GBA43]KAI8348792.1 hypothetical protein B0O80DRAFT_501836 [Mortierella sp. GBAus27b]